MAPKWVYFFVFRKVVLNFSEIAPRYASLGANLPTKSFREMAHRLGADLPLKSFSEMAPKYTSLEATLPTKSFSEMAPRLGAKLPLKSLEKWHPKPQ